MSLTKFRSLLLAALLLAATSGHATVALDVATESDTGTTGTTGSPTWNHTGGASADGAIVFCYGMTGSSTDPGDCFSGATYGGTSMGSPVTTAADTATERGMMEVYFLGNLSGLTGTQQVICTATGSDTHTKYGVAVTVTAATSTTQLAGIGGCSVSNNTANPSCSITGISGTSWAANGIFSGQPDNAGSITAGTGFTEHLGIDFGAFVCDNEYMTTQQASGSITCAFTAGTDDVAMGCVGIQEPGQVTRRIWSVQ